MRLPWLTPLGMFLLIPLEDGSFGYGRVHVSPFKVFYDCQTDEPVRDVYVIQRQPILFAHAVQLYEDDNWSGLDVLPLEGDIAQPVTYFWQDDNDDRECWLGDTGARKRKVRPEECVGVERDTIWSAQQIARRLLDTFMGLPNEDEIRSRVRFPANQR